MKVYFEKPAPPPVKTSWLGRKLDSFFEAVAPGYARARMQARRDLTNFAFRAARPTLNRELAGMGPHPNSSSVQRDAVSLMFEARDLAENVGFVKGHLRKTQLYGAGTLNYEPETGDSGMDSEITGFFDWFNENAHIGGEHTLTRLFQLALMGMTRDRDSMLCFVRDAEDDLLRLQIVEADQIGELFSFTGPRPDYIQGVFMDGPRRVGYRVYDRVGDMQYGRPQFVPAHDALFFFDPMRNSVRGITAYETSIQNIRDKFEILGYEKVTVKEISETGVVTYTQRGQADGFDYDREETNLDTANVSYIKHAESGTREYMGIGEKFDVVPHNRPSPTFQGFIKTLDMEDCMGLNLPYGFVVDPTESGGAVTRLIAHVANREFGRVQNDVLRPQLNRLRTIILADAMEHGLISRHKNFTKGFWMFPPPPTADVERESDISIREVRSGLSTRTGEWAMVGGSFRKKVQILKQEAIARRVAAAEATEELAALGYADQTVSPDEIYANSDNPAQDAQAQAMAGGGNAQLPALPSGKPPVSEPDSDNPAQDAQEISGIIKKIGIGGMQILMTQIIPQIRSGEIPREKANDTLQAFFGLTDEEAEKILSIYAPVAKESASAPSIFATRMQDGRVLTHFTSKFDEGDWITINGTHVKVGKGGEIKKGPKSLKDREAGAPNRKSPSPPKENSPRTKTILGDKPVSSEKAADILSKAPKSAEHKAFLDWNQGGSEKINDNPDSKQAKAFDATIRSLEPYRSSAPIYRGLSFKSSEEKQSFLDQITSSGEWESDRVAQSFTKDKYVTDMYSFANSDHSVLLEVSSHKTARDIEPIVGKINPTYQSEKEVLSLRGSKYRLSGIDEETGLGMRNRKRTVVRLEEI